jgi:hypothetical protein
VNLFTKGGTQELTTNQDAGELYIGGVQALAARDFNGNLFGMTTQSFNGGYLVNNWQFDGAPGRMFAIYGNSTLAGLNSNGSAIYQDPVSIESPPAPWTQIGAGAVRLIGHGAQLYAAVGFSF